MLFTPGKTEVTPKDVGYNAERLEVLKSHFQTLINDGEILCGMYCLSRKGKIFAHGAVGRRHYKQDIPAQPDDIRWIASITKVFAAVAIMKLVEDGVTRLDIPVGEVLPQFNTPPYNQITLWHLLTHTSGMHADGACYENKYQTSYWGQIDRAYKLHNPEKDGEFDWIAAALGTIGTGLRTKPGTEWAYNSFGFTILGAVIEKLTGIHANKYIEDYIAKPLGMKDTAFELTADKADRFIVTDEHTEEFLAKLVTGEKREGWISDKLNIPGTSGALDGTAYDLSIFGNMMLNKGTFNGTRILGRKSVEKMTTLQVSLPDYCWGANGRTRYHGVGFDMRRGHEFSFSEGTYMHEGAGSCALYIDPVEELVAAWIVPFAKDGWHSRALFNVQNIIWSGLE